MLVIVFGGWAVAVLFMMRAVWGHLLAQHSCQGSACRLAGLGLYLARLPGGASHSYNC